MGGGFCTVINCMDGRVQLPVIPFLQEHFGVRYVDSITEPGPVKILAERTDPSALVSIHRRLDISVHKHGSIGIAIVAHWDCAGNPLPEAEQRTQLTSALETVRGMISSVPVIGLWVDEHWNVREV